MSRHTIPLAIGVLLLGCGQPTTQGPAPSASTAASSAPVKPSVQRKTTPGALRAADEQACSAGKTDACRRMADRYRGYGHPAGCGLDRDLSEMAHGTVVESMRVRIKRTLDDEAQDKKSFLDWIGKACDLGDSDACMIEGALRADRQPMATHQLEAAAIRSDPNTSAFIGFHALWAPDKQDMVLGERKKCLLESSSACSTVGPLLTMRIKEEKPRELSADLMAKLQALGERTLDFGALFMLLDKHGYAPEMLAPLRAHAGKTLVQACVEGSCVCGDAAQSLSADDARVPDLARWGCENGEPLGCYLLGKLHEEGRGVEKDEVFARSLYETACPSTRPFSSYDYADYEPAACARLAEMAEGGGLPPKNRDRAVYYAEYACLKPGLARDHAFCVKLAKYWTTGVLSSTCGSYNAEYCRTSAQEAADVFYGPDYAPAEGKECQRPSVKAMCDALEPDVVALKKPKPGKKK